nr:uncharacterized protein LOC104099958 [Nicotiana tomentosiformis]
MSFRGHDEGETSTKRGNFIELLQWYADRDDEVKKVVLQSAPQNNMMIAPNIQKEIVNACAKEIIKAIVEDLNGDYFGILVDESKDVSHKEQMALVLRYVNKEEKLIERFLSIVHVKKITSSSLQKAIYDLLLEHSLSPSQIRGQGYDGASNMQGEINGLKTLILKDNPSIYCIHYFAHQLQLTLVAVAKKYCDVDQFFYIVAKVLNIVGSSFKRRNMLREDQAKKLEELQVLGEIHTGSGLNQELGLQRLELNSRFDAVNSNLLLGMASLSPDNSFANYDKDRIMKLATLYPHEFSGSKLEDLSYELDNYILFVKEDNDFSNLKGLGDLSETLVEIDLYKTWRLIFLLVKLSLILYVATATVERAFSLMKYIKNDLRSKIGDGFLNDCLVCYIEDEVFESVPNDAIIDRFQNMTTLLVLLHPTCAFLATSACPLLRRKCLFCDVEAGKEASLQRSFDRRCDTASEASRSQMHTPSLMRLLLALLRIRKYSPFFVDAKLAWLLGFANAALISQMQGRRYDLLPVNARLGITLRGHLV